MIWCLHGFLGRSDDFRFLEPMPIRCPDLFSAVEPIEPWAQRFTAAVASADAAPVILGYSMGGRLALHALLAAPDLFRAAVIISAGLGVDGAEREGRRAADEQWARRFEHDPWEAVIRDWNAQPLFGGRANSLERREADFDRGALAAALRLWSPASLPPLLPRLRQIAVPVLWVAGEHDRKYASTAQRAVEELPRGELWICPGSGHRVPWEQPDRFAERLGRFLEQIARR